MAKHHVVFAVEQLHPVYSGESLIFIIRDHIRDLYYVYSVEDDVYRSPPHEVYADALDTIKYIIENDLIYAIERKDLLGAHRDLFKGKRVRPRFS